MGKAACGAFAALGLIPLLSGCALTRPPGPSCAAFADTAPVEGPADLILRPSSGAYVRPLQHLFGKPQPLAASSAAPAGETAVTVNLLLMSGGGQWGAYGSGFLNGLYGGPTGKPTSGPASPPEIALGDYNDITGVSTGAIMTLAVWSAVIHARRGQADAARAALADLKTAYSYADPQLFRTENTLIYALFSNGLLDPKGRLERLLKDKIAEETPLFETDPDTQVEVGAVNLTNGNFYSFQLPEVVKAHASNCFSEILLASSAIPLAFPPRFMDGEPYADGGIRYLLYADRFARNVMAESRSSRRPITLNIRMIINGNQSANDPGQDAAAAVDCDASAPGHASRCPPIANSLLGSFAGMGSGEGLVPRVAQDVMPGQIRLDSVYRLYTRWRELGLPGSFKFTYVSNEELANPPAGAGLSSPCQAPPGTTSEHFNPPFEACLFAIGRYKGAAGQWDFSDAHGANVASAGP
jgi:hypothetical protein